MTYLKLVKNGVRVEGVHDHLHLPGDQLLAQHGVAASLEPQGG